MPPVGFYRQPAGRSTSLSDSAVLNVDAEPLVRVADHAVGEEMTWRMSASVSVPIISAVDDEV